MASVRFTTRPSTRRLESFIARFFNSRGDPLQGPIPGFLLPRRAARRAVEHLLQAPRVVHHLNGRCALAAQGAFADRMARVALDVDDVAAARGDHLAAADAAEGANRCRSGCAAGFERRNRRAAPRLRQGADRHRARRQSFEKLAAGRLWRRRACRIIAVWFHLILVFIFHSCLSAVIRARGTLPLVCT